MSLRPAFLSIPTRPLFLDFLAPRYLHLSTLPQQQRQRQQQRQISNSNSSTSISTSTKPLGVLSPSQKAYLTRALRINQAGELAATRIYTSQTPPLAKKHPELRPLLQHMHDQEAGHLSTFNTLLAKHRIRPTALRPVWEVASSLLGWGTAVMGREAAMACTEAVETEIGGHYNDQVRVLIGWMREMEDRGEQVPEELVGLVEEIRRIRDEELEHLDHAVDNDAREAPAWPVLTAVIRGGCRGAIWVCGRV